MIFREIGIVVGVVLLLSLVPTSVQRTTAGQFTLEDVPPTFKRQPIGGKNFECFTSEGRSAKHAFKVVAQGGQLSPLSEAVGNSIFLEDSAKLKQYRLTGSTTKQYDDILPNMSPDGCKIVFSRALYDSAANKQVPYTIWIMNVDGSEAHQLVYENETDDLNAKFIGYGQSIIFERSQYDSDNPQWWLINTDGSQLRQVNH